MMISSSGTKRKITKRPIVSVANEMEGRRPFLSTEDTENEWSSMNKDIWVSFFFIHLNKPNEWENNQFEFSELISKEIRACFPLQFE